jgi:hypothetical protein
VKFVQITVHFEYGDYIERLLDRCSAMDYIRYPMVEGKDMEGKHFGSQVFPGSFTVYQVQLDSEQIDLLFDYLESFRESKPAHRHIQAVVLPIERSLRPMARSEKRPE